MPQLIARASLSECVGSGHHREKPSVKIENARSGEQLTVIDLRTGSK